MLLAWRHVANVTCKKKRKERDEERQKYQTIEVIDKKEVTKKSLKVEDPLLEETGHILADLKLITQKQ